MIKSGEDDDAILNVLTFTPFLVNRAQIAMDLMQPLHARLYAASAEAGATSVAVTEPVKTVYRDELTAGIFMDDGVVNMEESIEARRGELAVEVVEEWSMVNGTADADGAQQARGAERVGDAQVIQVVGHNYSLEEAEVVSRNVTLMEDDVAKHEAMEPLSGTKARFGKDGTLEDNEGETFVQTAEAMEEATRALASIAGPRRDDQKVRKGTIAGAEAQLGEAEDVVAAAEEGEIGKKEISGGGRRFRGRTRGGQQRALSGDAQKEYRRQREQLKDLKK